MTETPAGLAFGVDIGGSGIKAAPVDLATGTLATERVRVATPQPATPEAVAGAVGEVVAASGWEGPLGVAFPGVVTRGVARTAANVDPSWIGTNIEDTLAAAAGAAVHALNDADAAGLAEAAYGAARGVQGLVVVTTLGTGIGTALLHDGELVANSELGHIELGGVDAETSASAAARDREELGWEKWAARLQRYYEALEAYLWPELFVVGGGISRKADRFLPRLELRTPIVAAELRNGAGIVGSALWSVRRARQATLAKET